jgi:hypothetical protein
MKQPGTAHFETLFYGQSCCMDENRKGEFAIVFLSPLLKDDAAGLTAKGAALSAFSVVSFHAT